MRVYKATYKDRDGKKCESAKWYVDIFDHNKLRHKIPAFADKRISKALGRNIENLINCRIAGLEPDSKLNQWIETLPDSLLRKFVSWGLIEGQRAEITKPLTGHINDYIEVLKAKGFSKGYIRHSKNRLERIVSDCRFHYFRDITRSAVEIYIGKLIKDGVSATTAGHFLESFKSFLNWAAQDQRIINNPIAKVVKPARDSKQKGILTPEQFVHLIKTTFEKNVLIENTTGQERAVLYLLAGTTGLRKNELLSLVWSDINLSGDSPFVRVRACIAKNGKEALQPLTLMVVSCLTAPKACIKPKDTDRVFLAFNKSINTAGLIRDDLTAAGIPLKDRDGNKICFHSLRNSFISFLANSQTPAKVIQKMARHSDPKLTFNTYARVLPESEQRAISFLPNFGDFVLSTSLDSNHRKQEIFIDNHRHKNSQDTLINAVLAINQTPRVGLEPTT
jgi:site-specific recombinase XerD